MADTIPGSRDPAVLYWFNTVREHGKVRFVPHRIDMNSGVGTQVVAGDLNGDTWPDIVVGNKKGTFVFIHQAKETDKRTWEAAQPMPIRENLSHPAAKSGPKAKAQPQANAAAEGVPAKVGRRACAQLGF